LILLGVVRCFSGPTSRALIPQLVPEHTFQNAVAWGSTVFRGATILGPAVGGLAYVFFRGAAGVYLLALIAAVLALLMTLQINSESKPRKREPLDLKTALAGLRYIWKKKIILGSISLDLFAVFLGGAVALLPVYAREILHTGPWGLGLLRTAPGVGAAVMAVALAHRPLRGRAGPALLWSVAGFGICTILFGVSRSLVLSLISLILLGAADMISVIIRA